MAKRGWLIGGAALALAVAAYFVWRVWILPIHVAAPEPSLTPDVAETLPRVPASILIAPIIFDLGPAIAQFEADVPRRFGSLEQRIRADSTARSSFAFTARRSPFSVRVEGSEIVIETTLEYEARAWYDPPLAPEMSAGCGGGSDPKPRLLLRIVSTPSFTTEWGLRTRTHADIVRFTEPRDQCSVTFLHVDVTGKVASALGEEMTRRLARFDQQVARVDMRRRIDGIWKKMERPIRLTDGVWLLIQPGATQLASFSGGGDTLVAVLRLEARPRIVTEMRLEDSTLVTPLPALRTTPDPSADAGTGTGTDAGLHVVLEGVFSYDAATDLMRKSLVGRVIRMAGRRMRIEDITLRGIGSGRVALGVTFSGAMQGRIFLTGTPQLDVATRQLAVPDLDFDVGSTHLVARGLSWWQGGKVRDVLRANAVIPDSSALARLQRLAENGMNRELTAGARLQVTLSGSRGMAVWATQDHLVVRALAEGQARLAVDRVLARARIRSSTGPWVSAGHATFGCTMSGASTAQSERVSMHTRLGPCLSMRDRISVAVRRLTVCVAILVLANTRAEASELPMTRLRIRIPARGIYELSPADLAIAGVPVHDPGFDPRTLRLVFDSWKAAPLLPDSIPASWQPGYEMSEVAIWVPGQEDGKLDAEDRVVFYALGPAGWDDLAGVADSLAYSQHPYDRFEYGWLVWGGAPGLRMESRSASAPEPVTDPLVTRVWHREHLEEDHAFVDFGDLLAWQQIRRETPTTIDFDLDLGGDSTAIGAIRLLIGTYYLSGNNAIAVQLNDIAIGSATNFHPNAAEPFTFELASLRAHNRLILRRTSQSSSGIVYLFEFDVTWARSLMADARGELAWSTRPEAAPHVEEFGGFGAIEPLLLDVTDRLRPVRLTGLTPVADSARWRVRDPRAAGHRVHYLATATPRRLDAATDLEMRDVAPLRSRTTTPDMLIVTHPDLLPAAERLAAHRRNHLPGVSNPDVLVTTTRDIYDNFSGGRQDPLAIRNWIKWLYGLSSEPRLAYLLLLGDATRDPRQVLPNTPPTLVPTVHPLYADPRSGRAYAVEDWFVAMHRPPAGVAFIPQADVSIGRLPARDLLEADQMADKILAYESEPLFGPWRGRVLIAADDECNPSAGCYETYFIDNAEDLVATIPPEFDVDKVYMTEYPLVASQKPAARAALIRAWNEGCALFSYQGRGSASQLADEVLLLASDVPALTNGARLPLVLQFHDDAAEFDRTTTQSYEERLVASPNGGAIAAIGPTTASYLGAGFGLAVQQFAQLFRAGIAAPQPIGLVHRLAKGRPNTGTEHFMLLGDPALVLNVPKATVTFTSGADSLAVGRRARIEGIVHLPGKTDPLASFDGQAEIEVLGNADASGYRRTEPPPLVIPYVLPGAPVYRGSVPVRAGRFAFEFTVPPPLDSDSASAKNTRLLPGGRVAAYAWNALLDAKGGRDGVILRRGEAPDSSLAPPQIRLTFPGDARRVVSGALLTATLDDDNGIWIAGLTPASSIRVQLDGGDLIEVTTAYRSSAGSDRSGTVSVPLPALAPGSHQATLFASDNLGNAASASLDFEIIGAPILRLTDFRAGPNPTRAGADFAFLLDIAADIELRVFSVDGREVFRTRQHHDGLRRGLLQWNGKSTHGHAVASGIYLYRLGVRPAGAPIQEVRGKLAVLR